MAVNIKVKADPTFEAIAKIPCPGGKVKEVTFIFKHKGRKEFAKLLASFNDSPETADLVDVIEGWKGMDSEFSKESFEEFLDDHFKAEEVITRLYIEELTQAKAGN